MNREGESILDKVEGEADYEGSLDRKSSRQIIEECAATLNNILGNDYTLAPNGKVQFLKEPDNKTKTMVDSIERKLMTAMAEIQNAKIQK